METSTRPRRIPDYFWLTWWGVTGPKWLKEVIPPHLPCSDVQVQVQCDHFSPESLCVAGKCWWIFGEIITICAAQKCINIPEVSVFWTIGSPQVRILTVTNLMPPSHFHIWSQRKTKTPSNCLHTDPHILNSSQMLTHLRILWSLSANERPAMRPSTNQKTSKWPRCWRVWGSASLGTLRVLSKTKYLG